MEQHPKAARLLKVLDAVRRRLDAVPTLDILDEDAAVVDVAKTYMHAMLAQARAVAVLADSGVAECSYTNLRSLFESYVDLRYLLTSDQRIAAHRVILYAMHDLLATYDHLPDPDKEARDGVLKGIANRGQENPAAYAAFQLDWSTRRRGHWSGLSRTALIRQLDPDPKSLLLTYKALSLESHTVLAAVLDYERDHQGFTAQHRYREPQTKVAGFTCTQATISILAAWDGFHHYLPKGTDISDYPSDKRSSASQRWPAGEGT